MAIPNQPQEAPYSYDAEQALLGALLIDGGAFLGVSSFLSSDDFFLMRHRHVWEAMQRLSERRAPIDVLTVADELSAHRQLDAIGGPAFLVAMQNNAPTSVYAEVYGQIVERASVRRRLLTVASEVGAIARDETMDIDRVIQDVEGKLFAVTQRQLRRDFTPMSEAVDQYFERIERLMEDSTLSYGVPSGFRDLDALLGGFQRSDLLVFAGRPGMGKTSFLLSAAMNAARLGQTVGIFTMEMGVDQLVQRMISMETGINSQTLRLGKLTPGEYSRFTAASGRVAKLPIFIDDTPALNPIQLRTKCRRLKHEHHLDMIIVDYMQLMNGGSGFQNNRVQEISYISRSLKELARELNVPLFSAAQLSRAVEQRQDKRPQLSDLRESGSIEQDSDIVIFLYRDVVYNEATEFPSRADLLVSKHRNGPTGTISLHFEKSLTKFSDARTQTIDLSSL
jgi:replicative DNA helicase